MAGAAPARELPPRLELACLKALWELGDATVRDIQQALERDRKLAYTTVMTIMDRLVRRGCVRRRKRGRSFVYTASMTRDAVVHLAVDDLLRVYFDGSAARLTEYLGAHDRSDETVAHR